MTTILLMAAWYIVGMLSFCHWWRSEYDLSVAEIPLVLLAGVTGPASFLMGWLIHSDGDLPTLGGRVLWRKRNPAPEGRDCQHKYRPYHDGAERCTECYDIRMPPAPDSLEEK